MSSERPDPEEPSPPRKRKKLHHMENNHSNSLGMEEGPFNENLIEKEEFVRLILQAVRDLGYG